MRTGRVVQPVVREGRERPIRRGLRYCLLMYSFRVPLRVSNSNPDTIADQLTLAESDHETLWLQSNGPLADAERETFCGSGYPTPKAAEQRAMDLLPALRLTSLQTGIHFDFLSRETSGGMSDAALHSVNQCLPTGVRAVRHRSGVTSHLTSDEIIVPRLGGVARAYTPAKVVSEHFQSALSTANDSPRASLAFDLYVASWRMPTIDSRVLMLTSAAEAMLTVRKVPPEERQALRRLAAAVRADELLTATGKQSLENRIGSLHKESVSSASARLAERLAPRIYLDRSARDFFSYAYDVRSRLVHGATPPPTAEVAHVLTALGLFVHDLIELEFTSPEQRHESPDQPHRR